MTPFTETPHLALLNHESINQKLCQTYTLQNDGHRRLIQFRSSHLPISGNVTSKMYSFFSRQDFTPRQMIESLIIWRVRKHLAPLSGLLKIWLHYSPAKRLRNGAALCRVLFAVSISAIIFLVCGTYLNGDSRCLLFVYCEYMQVGSIR